MRIGTGFTAAAILVFGVATTAWGAAGLPEVKTDAANPDVTDAERANPQPRRGGKLRIRTKVDHKDLSIILNPTQPAHQVMVAMTDSLVDRDMATLEFFPELAWTWSEADLLKTKTGAVEVGRIAERTDATVTFVPGARKRSFAFADVAEAGEGFVMLSAGRGGSRIEGTVTKRQYVYEVDEATAAGRAGTRRTIPVAELDVYTVTIGSERQERPFLKPSCAWEFQIREGATWQDGKPFTAADVEFSFRTIMNPQVDAAHRRPDFDFVESLAATADGRGVEVRAKRPYFKSLEILGGAKAQSWFLPRHVFAPEKFGGDEKAFAEAFNKHPFSTAPVYTGPYRLAEFKPGDRVTLVRHDGYWKSALPDLSVGGWRSAQPWLDELSWIVYGESAASVKDLQNGKLDVEYEVEPTTWVQPDTNTPAFTAAMIRQKDDLFGYTYVGWHLDNPLFRDPQVRLALAMLMPREDIAQKVHMGAAFPISGPFRVGTPAYDSSVANVPFDPEKARRMLKRAGWLDRDGDGVIEKEIDGKMVPFQFTYLIHNALDYHQKIADIIKENVEQAGIRVTISKNDWSTFADLVRERKFDAVRYAWGMEMDPDPFPIFHSSQIGNNGDNFIGYRNARVDRICESIREEMDQEKRWELCRELHRIVAEEQAQCFQFAFNTHLFASRKLRGIRSYPSPYPLDFTEWWWAEDASAAAPK